MRRSIVLAAAVALLAGTAIQAKAASLLTNGGFESGTFSGWTLTLAPNDCCAVVQSGAGNGYQPNTGMDFAYIGTRETATLSQTFSDTAGQTLQISFFFASNGDVGTNPNPPNGGNQLMALFNGATEFSQTNIPATGANPNFPYVEETFDVTATGSDTLTFSFYDIPSALALDDASVTSLVSATPLPATLPLFAGGLGLVGFLTKRRKGAKQALAAA